LWKELVRAAFVDVMQSDFAGTPVAMGDIVTGSFQYDTSVDCLACAECDVHRLLAINTIREKSAFKSA
jgi:hypothetical protein